MVKDVLIDYLPLWSILPLTIVVALVSVEVGYRVASYRQRRSQEEKESPVGSMVGATLGLLAFMLAFTFGLAGSRFEDRRQVLLSEANAVGTTYLRAAMLPEPMRTEAQNLLREYVDVRLDAVHPGKLNQSVLKSEELHIRLWSLAVAATEKDRSPITGLFVQSLNEVIDLHATRVMAGLRSRVPDMIWIVLFVLAILAMVLMGYHSGLAHSRRSIAVIALILESSEGTFTVLHVGDSNTMPAVSYPEVPGWTWKKVLRSGEVIDGIVKTAKDLEADLVVMSTDGRNGFLDGLRGSHSERVLRYTATPLLTVPVGTRISRFLI